MSPPGLPDLAQQIEAEHQKAVGAFRTTLEHAIRCGELLTEAKAQIDHGGWLPWIKANLTIKPRQVQAYMRVHAHRESLNAQANAHLTISSALNALTELPLVEQIDRARKQMLSAVVQHAASLRPSTNAQSKSPR